MQEVPARGITAGATPKQLLKDRAYEEIKRLIIIGDFPAGTFLSERGLAERLDMSKTPIRAAIERLAAEGFVSVSPQQGIVVHSLSLEEVVDIFDIREALETFVVRRLAGRLTEEQKAQLRENLHAHHRYVRSNDIPHSVEQDSNFHLLLCKFLGNREIMRVMARQHDKLNLIIASVLRNSRNRNSDSFAEHKAIAEAIIEGDAEGAAELVETHLMFGRRFLLSR